MTNRSIIRSWHLFPTEGKYRVLFAGILRSPTDVVICLLRQPKGKSMLYEECYITQDKGEISWESFDAVNDEEARLHAETLAELWLK